MWAFSDRLGPKKLLEIASSLDSLVWALKALVTTSTQVFIISGLRALTATGQMIPLDSLIYERARHNNIVAFIVQREVGLSASRFIFLLVTGILLWFGLPLVFIFIFAALATLLTRFYPENTNSKTLA